MPRPNAGFLDLFLASSFGSIHRRSNFEYPHFARANTNSVTQKKTKPMYKIISYLVFIIHTINLCAQPGDDKQVFNESAYTQPFLHCVTDEKDFAKYAIEARQYGFKMMDHIKCKLYIPSGINKIWQTIEKSHHPKGEFDYTNDFWIGIRFNLYIDGTKVSTAYQIFEKKVVDTGSFAFFFDLNPINFSATEGEINYAYVELLKKLTNGYHRIYIQAAMPSKNLVTRNSIPIVSGGFLLHAETEKIGKWKELLSVSDNVYFGEVDKYPNKTNYNARLKYLADSTMKRIFGNTGFSKNFKMTCLKNPCVKGYQYANMLESNNPCTSEPQDSCKEAIITYAFVKKDVPLTIKMLVTIKENAEIVYIENNQYRNKEISIEQQNILSIPELRKKIRHQLSKDSFFIPAAKNVSYAHTRIEQPESSVKDKMYRDPGYKLIKETKAGKKWERGFIYSAQKHDPKTQKRIYHFDAVTGELLWITEVHKVPFDSGSH